MTMPGKRRRKSIDDLQQREVGGLPPRLFAHRAGASELPILLKLGAGIREGRLLRQVDPDFSVTLLQPTRRCSSSTASLIAFSQDLVLRLRMQKKLNKHKGCVNTVSFNTDGSILVSGSDDLTVMLWDWDAGVTKLVFESGHTDNVFQARFMPWTGDRTIITCAADGEVRLAQIVEGGNVATKMLARHEGPAHKMDIEPGSPHIFYSCGEDGLVQHFDLRTQSATKLFTCKSFQRSPRYARIVDLNAIAIDPRNPNLFAIAGSDEYARVYDIRKYNWDGSNDFGHPADNFCPRHMIGDKTVSITGLAFSDHSELLASYSREFIYLFTREQGLGTDPVFASTDSVMDANAGQSSSSACASTNSYIGSDSGEGSSSISASADSDRDADIGEGFISASASSSAADPNPSLGPQAYKGHINRNTVKGVSFFGPNCEYVVSGSDCGHIFIWRKKGGELLRAMKGDKHVVNCTESHPYATTIASSGIENTIKIWSPSAEEPARPVTFEDLKQIRISRLYNFDDYDSDEDWTEYEDDDDVLDSESSAGINSGEDPFEPDDADLDAASSVDGSSSSSGE